MGLLFSTEPKKSLRNKNEKMNQSPKNSKLSQFLFVIHSCLLYNAKTLTGYILLTSSLNGLGREVVGEVGSRRVQRVHGHHSIRPETVNFYFFFEDFFYIYEINFI